MTIWCCVPGKRLRKFIAIFSLLCTVVLNSCVTSPRGVSVDLNYLIFGKEDDIDWTHNKLNGEPSNVRVGRNQRVQKNDLKRLLYARYFRII
jgi:hypothetical protein